MSKSLRVTLSGIILILASLFIMGICVIDVQTSGPEGLALGLFVLGIIVSIAGIFFVKE
ncbi:MAG: hypothetical protein OSJ58_16745 [Dysosmobacter sp.]|nr:hypothetical protein [Dysosmobacter sp.]